MDHQMSPLNRCQRKLRTCLTANEHSAPGIDPVAPPLGDVLESVASCCVIFDCLITRLSNEPLNFYLLHRISVHIFFTDCLYACLNAAIVQWLNYNIYSR